MIRGISARIDRMEHRQDRMERRQNRRQQRQNRAEEATARGGNVVSARRFRSTLEIALTAV